MVQLYFDVTMLPVGRPWQSHLAEVLGSASQSVVVSAPYVSSYGAQFLAEHTPASVREAGTVTLLTDLSPANVAQGATEVGAILSLSQVCTTLRLVHLARLHAKVYVADDSAAIVSSGNLTRGGLVSNFEYGVRLNEAEQVARVRQDVLDYAAIGTAIGAELLAAYAEREQGLRQASNQARKDTHLQEAMTEARAVLMRPYQTNESFTQAFGRAILFILRRDGPLTTPDIHERVRVLLPELCDDGEDRIIDGRHFGKLWKHRVRIAQSYLKRNGRLRLEGSLWSTM